MTTAQRIVDFDDPDFNPFVAIDQMQGLEDVADPYPWFHAMQEKGSVIPGKVREGFGMAEFAIYADRPSYMVFGHKAVSEAFSDAASMSNALKKLFYDDSFGDSINGMDGPEHMRYRKFFQKAFMPQTVARWGNEIVPDVLNRLIDNFADKGRAELVSEFTALFPFYVIYKQLKMPEVEREIFQKLAVGLTVAGMDPLHSREANRKMGDYFKLLLDERRAEHASGELNGEESDLLTLLAVGEVDGERLPDEIAISFLRQLMAAAGDTTYRSAGSMLTGLLNNPDQLDAVCKDRSLVPKVVEEALRWEPPIVVETRLATRDLVLDGVSIPEGAKLDVVMGSANRDPAKYENPDEFNIFRKQDRHLAFAYGPHVCIGQHLARLELTKALDALLDRLPNMRLDPDKPAPSVVGLISRSPIAVHVVFD